MNLSERYEQDYLSACRSGADDKEKHRLWNRWQDQCIAEGKFHVKGKKVVGW